MDFRIALDGHHAEDSSQGFRALCDGFVTALRDAGYTITGSTYDWDSEDCAAGKPCEEGTDDGYATADYLGSSLGDVVPEDAIEAKIPEADEVGIPKENVVVHRLGESLRWHSDETTCKHCGGLSGIDFASDNAAERAAFLGLSAPHFKGIKSTGKGGYTVKDVLKAAK